MQTPFVKVALAIAFLPALCFAQTYTFSTLVNFTNAKRGPYYPSNLIIDGNGNLYGTSYGGGTYGNGTVFRVSPTGTVSTLHSFAGYPTDGTYPYAALTRDSAGNLYGTTYSGGSVNICSGRPGCGTVFKLSATTGETVLYNFTDGADGALPTGSLTLDSAGNLYGLTGGNTGGVMFKITPSGAFSTIYDFDQYPGFGATLIENPAGDFFGTNYNGGSGYGNVFEVTPEGQETTLYSFTGGTGGSDVNSKLTQDSHGNLYGTTFAGGSMDEGAVFKITASGVYSVVYSFCQLAKCADGYEPYGWLTRDSQGNLYGLTYSNPQVVFKVTATGEESVIYSGIGGNWPDQGPALVMDRSGNLYGTTFTGGSSGVGQIFKLTRN